MKYLTLALVLVTTLAIQQRSASDSIAGPAKEPERPYSCRMYDEAAKKCAANSIGPCYVQHEVDRLRRQCLTDGGRP